MEKKVTFTKAENRTIIFRLCLIALFIFIFVFSMIQAHKKDLAIRHAKNRMATVQLLNEYMTRTRPLSQEAVDAQKVYFAEIEKEFPELKGTIEATKKHLATLKVYKY